MKKFGFAAHFSTLIACALIFTGCQTAMQIDKEIPPLPIAQSDEIPNMEFIGFKTMTMGAHETWDAWEEAKNYSSIKNLGSNLQYAGIAIDQSFAYFGIYSLQELEAYRNVKRYITFVEVTEHSYNVYRDINEDRRLIGAVLTGLVVTAPIGIPLLFTGYKTQIRLKGSYKIYVYDSQTNSIIYTDEAKVSQTDIYKGLYDNTGKLAEYYGALTSNAILEKYISVKKFLATRQ